MRFHPYPIPAVSALGALAVLTALALPASTYGTPELRRARSPLTAIGTLAQLQGAGGCLVDRSKPNRAGCTRVRALNGPAPFLGSEAIAISPDGRNVYVAASRSNAIAVFRRNARTGRLTQGAGAAGCIAADGAGGCAKAVELEGPNSVAVSADGKSVYATSLDSDAVDVFLRNPRTGALRQATDDKGCIANVTTSGCTLGRALDGPDVVSVSPDGRNVYVGAFKGDSIAIFDRDASTGTLSQPTDISGCIVELPTSGCTTGLALASPEGMAVSPDGQSVYVAAALSSALDMFTRNQSTGALAQASNGTGCIVAAALPGCTTGVQIGGADAVAVSPDNGEVYLTSVLSNSLSTFTRAPSTGQLTQQAGTSACAIYLLAVGCSLGRELDAPEGLTVSPEGASVYATAFASGAIDAFNRNGQSGALIQKSHRAGCLTTSFTPGCTRARALLGVSSAAVSPDGRYLYAAAFASNAVSVFRRITASVSHAR
jgi:DNA-binding beta-propeller fold protein YncE